MSHSVKNFIRKKPLASSIIVIVTVMVIYWILSSLELIPELPRWRQSRGIVVEKGDSYDWSGMQLAPVSRNIRKEFRIPARVKGMFVLDEGTQAAKNTGLRPGM